MGIQIILERSYRLGRRGGIGSLGRLVEADEVHPAIQACKGLRQLGGMEEVVVEPLEHRIFKRHASLAAPIVAAEELQDI